MNGKGIRPYHCGSGLLTIVIIYIGTQENGQETCVVETQTVGANCGSGGCKQTCTVTPIRGESDKNCPTYTRKYSHSPAASKLPASLSSLSCLEKFI